MRRRTFSDTMKAVRSGDIPRLGEPASGAERRLLEYLYRAIRDRGYQPSLREMADELGYENPSGPMYHMIGLYQKGYLAPQVGRGRSRNTVLLKRPDGSPFNGFTERE